MNDYLALLVVIAIVSVICWLARGGVYRRCRCGAQYCNGCNARRQR